MNAPTANLSELGDNVSYLCNRLSKVPNKDGVDTVLLRDEDGGISAMLVRPELYLTFSSLVYGMIQSKIDPIDVLEKQIQINEKISKETIRPPGKSGVSDEDLVNYLRGLIDKMVTNAQKIRIDPPI